MRSTELRPAASGRRRRVAVWAVVALAAAGVLVAPVGRAVAASPGTVALAPASVVAGSTGTSLAWTFTASASSFSGTFAVVVPTSGSPTTGFRPVPSASSVSVQKGTCTSAVLAASNYAPVTLPAYPGDAPGTRISVIAKCPAGNSLTLTYTGVTVPQRAQAYTFYSTAAGQPLAVQPVLAVTPAATTRLAVEAPGTTVAGVGLRFQVTAKDAYYNYTPAFTGPVRFTTTDPAVRFLPRDYTFTAADGGTHGFAATLVGVGSRRITATTVAGAPSGSDTVQVTDAAVSVSGTVLSNMDPIVSDATVTVYDADSGRVLGSQTDVSYSFTFTGLPAGHLWVGVTAPDYLPGFSAPLTLAPGDVLGPDWDQGAVVLELWPAQSDAALHGRVVGRPDPASLDSIPLAGATVTVYYPGDVAATTTTEPDGRYEIGGLVAGRYRVTASMPGWVGATADVAVVPGPIQGPTFELASPTP